MFRTTQLCAETFSNWDFFSWACLPETYHSELWSGDTDMQIISNTE